MIKAGMMTGTSLLPCGFDHVWTLARIRDPKAGMQSATFFITRMPARNMK
jgi:hypothetical protein